jgi:hypothetical protein
MSPDDLRTMALAFPGAEEGFNMGSTVFKVNGKVLARLLSDDVAMIVGVGLDEREMLLAAEPETFHITPHWKDYPGMMANLANLDPAVLHDFLERRFRAVARKSVVKAYDAQRT